MKRTAQATPDPYQAERLAAGCTCGWWNPERRGTACSPNCPAYEAPPPTQVLGHVSISKPVKSQKPDTATYRSFVLEVGAAAQQLMGKDRNRVRAIVMSDQVLMIGKRGDVNARYDPAVGELILENQDELWAMNTDPATAANVTVIQERWT